MRRKEKQLNVGQSSRADRRAFFQERVGGVVQENIGGIIALHIVGRRQSATKDFALPATRIDSPTEILRVQCCLSSTIPRSNAILGNDEDSLMEFVKDVLTAHKQAQEFTDPSSNATLLDTDDSTNLATTILGRRRAQRGGRNRNRLKVPAQCRRVVNPSRGRGGDHQGAAEWAPGTRSLRRQ